MESFPPTRYDLQFTVTGIPVRVHPLFWLMALFLGLTTANMIHLLGWVLVVFVSILFHELGHAWALRFYGRSSRIVLHLLGGATIPETSWWGSGWAGLTLNQQILVFLVGPGAGFLLAVLALLAGMAMGGYLLSVRLFHMIPFPVLSLPNTSLGNSIVQDLLWVNLGWGVINLLPIYPLDGGQVVLRLFLQAYPEDGLRRGLWLSVIAGSFMALFGLLSMKSPYVMLLFGMLAFQSYQALQSLPR